MRKISNFGKKLKGTHAKLIKKTARELDIINIKNMRVLSSCNNEYKGRLILLFTLPNGKVSKIMPDNKFYEEHNGQEVTPEVIIERYNTIKFNLKSQYYIITKHKQYEHKTWRKDRIRKTSSPIQPIHNGKR